MLKQAHVCCAFRWSPPSLSETFIAAGSVAGAMGDDFNTDAFLEIRRVDCRVGGDDMPVVGRVVMPDRVHRIDWSPKGSADGVIAVGYTDGMAGLWSAEKIMSGDADTAPLCTIPAHQAAVTGVHFNALQPSFLATAGRDRELAIWAIDDPSDPKSVPALNKSTHTSEITDCRWNAKYPHIIATSTTGGIVTVWDLKAKRTAVSFAQPSPANAIAWNTEISTQIAVARDDGSVQLWDLKKAMAPIKELKAHERGVMGLSWSPDGQLLLSCGCDGRTYCWDTTTGLSMGELQPQDNWIYDVQWAPRTPAVLAMASFDAVLSVHSAQQLGGPAARTPPKWLARPATVACGHGGVIARVIQSPNPHSISIGTLETSDTLISDEHTFRTSSEKLPAASAERVAWIRSHDAMLGALAMSYASHNRRPMQEAILDVGNAESETPEKLVARGDLEGAVDVCINGGNFADAFAIAHLKGPELVGKVQQAYLAGNTSRLSVYLQSIRSQDFTTLPALSLQGTSWRECLSLLLSFASAEALTDAANAVGEVQQTGGSSEAAAWAFMNAGNINRLVEHWAKTTSLADLIHRVVLFETTCHVTCTSPAYGEALARYAAQLAAAGDNAGAYEYARRAVSLGVDVAGEVIDRLQYRVSMTTPTFPYPREPIPDAVLPELQMMGTNCVSATPTPTPVIPNPPVPTHPTAHSDPVGPTQGAAYAQGGPQAQGVTYAQGGPQAQGATYAQGGPQAQGGMSQGPSQFQGTPQEHHSASPYPASHDDNRPPARPAGQADKADTAVPRTSSPPPEVPRASAVGSSGDGRVVGATAKGNEAKVLDTSAIADTEVRQLMSHIVAAAARIPERLRREKVERAASELVDHLVAQRVPADVMPTLINFLRVAGTPASKEAWRQISDKHYAVCQPYANLKFL